MIEDKLTVITPVRLGHPQDLINCIMSMTSLYVVLGPNRPQHMISPCDYRGLPLGPRLTQRFKDMLISNFKPDYEKAKKCLEQLGANWKEVAPMSTPVQALVSCLQNTSTEYTYIHLADVGFINGKNVFDPCIDAMHKRESLCQVRIGGYPFSNQKKNTDVITAKYPHDHTQIQSFSNDVVHPFSPIYTNDGTVWYVPMKAEFQRNFFPIPLWNCIMRTSFLKKVVQQAIELAPVEPRTLTDLVKVVNGATDLVEYNLYSTGWREEFKWIEDLEQGVLNMACYQYAWGREENTPAHFAANNTIEIR